MKLSVSYICVAASLTLSVSSWSRAEEQKRTTDEALGTGGIVSFADWLKGNTSSDKAKCVIGVYTDVLGIHQYTSQAQVATKNVGHENLAKKKIAEDPCTLRHAINFLRRLRTQEEFGTGSLADQLGSGAGKAFAPGWVWKQALEEAGGNPAAAFSMMQLCGSAKDYPSYELRGEDAEAEFKVELARRRQLVSSLEYALEQLKGPKAAEAEKFRVAEQLKTMQQEVASYEKKLAAKDFKVVHTLECNAKLLHANKGLSADADISEELKTKISKFYHAPQEEIPGKHYHTYTSAFMGCELAKCGLSPAQASKVEETAAWAYRSITQCAVARPSLEMKELLEKNLKRPLNQIKPEMLLSSETHKAFCAMPSKNEMVRYLCDTLAAVKVLPNEARKIEFLESILQTIDAAVLYKDWYLGGPSKITGDLPCTDIRILGPRNLLAASDPAKPGHNPCVFHGLSNERCGKAMEKLAEWDVDFEWTRAQHAAGAKFGAEKCQGRAKEEDLEKALCAVLVQKVETTQKQNPTAKPTTSEAR